MSKYEIPKPPHYISSGGKYVPAVMAREMEVYAIKNLSDEVKKRIIPFFCISEMPSDPRPNKSKDKKKEKKQLTPKEHTNNCIAKISEYWGDKVAWIRVRPEMRDQFIDRSTDTDVSESKIYEEIFINLHEQCPNAIPAIEISLLESSPLIINIVKEIIDYAENGLAIIISEKDLEEAEVDKRMSILQKKLNCSLDKIDLIIDYNFPITKYRNIDKFTNRQFENIKKINIHTINSARSFVMITSRIPKNPHKTDGNDIRELERLDWEFYETIVKKFIEAKIRIPWYGDYTITPAVPKLIGRKQPPVSVNKLVYTLPKKFVYWSAGIYESDHPDLIQKYCQELIKKDYFYGAEFSWGDRCIVDLARGISKNYSKMNLCKAAGINHHITHVVVMDLASLPVLT